MKNLGLTFCFLAISIAGKKYVMNLAFNLESVSPILMSLLDILNLGSLNQISIVFHSISISVSFNKHLSMIV